MRPPLAPLLRQERAGMLGWGLGLLAYAFFIGWSYAFIAESAADYDQIWESMPEGLREAFGGDAGGITSVPGYYTSQLGSYLPVLLGLAALAACTKRFAGAEETGLLDHLLARPVTRIQHFGTNAMAIAASSGLVLLATLAGTLLGFALSGLTAGEVGRLALAVLDVVPILAFFLGLGLLLGSAFHRRGPAFGIALAVALGGYALEVVAQVVDALSWLSYANPYGYYGRSDAFSGDPDLLHWLLLPLLGVLMASAGGMLFARKDLKS